MKAILASFAVILFLGVLALGNGRLLANTGGKQTGACGLRFNQLDSGHKGYLTRHDFDRGWEGPLGNRDIGPYGNARSGFAAADRNANGRVSAGEYCNWQSHE